MRRRFFCDSIPAPGDEAVLSAAESHHLARVLRGRSGEQVTLLDGAGAVAAAEIDDVGSRRKGALVRCRVIERRQVEAPMLRPVLFISPPRQKQMSSIVRQATELGVWTIRPITVQRSVARPQPEATARWTEDAREACKQSGNPFLPTIHPPAILQEALDASDFPGHIGWVPGNSESDSRPWSDDRVRGAAGQMGLWIGPEGGFAEDEAAQILAHGVRPLGLGPWVLRVETAVIAGLSWLNYSYRL